MRSAVAVTAHPDLETELEEIIRALARASARKEHPAALREYGRHVEQLQSVFSDGVTQDLAEAAGKIRNLVARVTLIPQENGFKMELEGRLALLMQAPKLYPNMRIAASGGSMVAEEGLEPPTRGL